MKTALKPAAIFETLTRALFVVVSCVFVFCFSASSVSAQSIVTSLGDGITLSDIGIDPVTNELVFVGSELEANEEVAKVFHLSSDRTSLSSDTLVGLGAGTVVNGISSDGSRAAGFSESAASIDTEGISWSLNNPESPQAIGFVPGFAQNSFASSAWPRGVVGNHSGLRDAIAWTEEQDITVLPDGGGLSTALDVNVDGNFSVGFSNDFGAVAGAVFWDESGIHQLEDPFGRNSIARAVSPSSEYIGGDLVVFDPETFQTGTQAAVWGLEDDDYLLTLLEIENSSSGVLERLHGTVNDVSVSGYAVGETLGGRGFIWHESFNGIDSEFLGTQFFDDWLFETQGIALDSPSRSLVGIAEDQFGELHFAVNGSAFIVSDVQVTGVPEPSSSALLLLAFSLLLPRRFRQNA